MTRASASAPGSGRLLAPALLAWGLVAAAVTNPGAGRWLGIAALVLGVVAVVVRRFRGGAVLLPYTAIACAMIVVLGARIDALEAVRADAGFAEVAASGQQTALDIELRGFPKAAAASSDGGPSAWVPAAARSARGPLPVVLWFDDDAVPGAGAAPDHHAGPPETWGPGTALRVEGALVVLDPGSSAQYGVRVASFAAGEEPEPGGPWRVFRAAVTGAAAEMRSDLRAAAMQVPGAELVPGLAVGDTSLLSERLEQQMQVSSLTHLTAVSGANCALVIAAITTLAAWLRTPRRVRLSAAALGLTGFVIVVGPDPSLQRAAVMAAVVLASSFGGKRAVALPGLGIATFALLMNDPWQALQPGFALSVAATAGILLWTPGIAVALGRIAPSPAWLRTPIAVAVAAQFACGPLLLLVQPGFPAAGLIANVLAAPAAPWGTGLGLLAMLAAQLVPSAGTALIQLAGLPARWIAATADVTSALPGARWQWPGGWGGALLLALVEGAVLVAWGLLARRFAERHVRAPVERRGQVAAEHDRIPSITSGRVPWGRTRPRPRHVTVWVAALLCGAVGVFLGPTLVVPAAIRLTAPRDWNVVACDVGQGDALLLRDANAPERVMLVDTGDDPERLTSCLDRFGVQRIAILVLTHDDRDHVGALGAIADRTERALVAPNNREDGEARPVLEQLSAAGVPARVGQRGMREALGGLAWEVLAPDADAVPPDTNSASLVLRVQAGETSVLMLADTGEDEQRALQRSGAALDVDVLKVAHHGSADHDPLLLARATAEVALISVGAENSYGHPARAVTDELTRLRTTVLRTDRMGSIAIGGAPGALDLWVERGATAAAGAARGSRPRTPRTPRAPASFRATRVECRGA
ncbi:ComEC/Rec2 family competence protein [Leucobacter chromiiresistens]|uniref:ComEC/Rec2 family competence protein n=1 Tax=Leucobacter chromiiresistens TaxID=1079994 RepID=UPI000AA81CBC|nr:ComEC/Rec2 family competence protein [Leucobacter chromiiresistens]